MLTFPTTCPVCGADFTKAETMEWRGSRRTYRAGLLNADGTESDDAEDGWSEGDTDWDAIAYCLICDSEIGPTTTEGGAR